MITSRSCEQNKISLSLSAARRVFSERQPQRKRVDGLAPARPRNGGVPSTARPSHLGGRASGTWPDKEKSESGDEIDKRSAAFPLRCLRGALHLWRCLSEVYFRSRADVSLCALPLSSSNPPPSPFSSYLSSVCLLGADGFVRYEAAPSRRLDGYQKFLPYREANGPENL